MSAWNAGRVYTRSLCGEGRFAYIEIRDDIADGWEWMIYEGSCSRTFHVETTLAKAKRASMCEAKRLGLVGE